MQESICLGHSAFGSALACGSKVGKSFVPYPAFSKSVVRKRPTDLHRLG